MYSEMAPITLHHNAFSIALPFTKYLQRSETNKFECFVNYASINYKYKNNFSFSMIYILYDKFDYVVGVAISILIEI